MALFGMRVLLEILTTIDILYKRRDAMITNFFEPYNTIKPLIRHLTLTRNYTIRG